MSSLAKAGALFSVCVKLLMISIENEKIVVEYMWQKFECTYDFILHYYVKQLVKRSNSNP